ncbi:MAG: acetate--CoA ligase family protein [Rhodobacteraceae bacterium]|nr:acetate--CoA ligase family protein [Paracoccaceae bacterium]
MSAAKPRLSVRDLLHPRSVAVFGASEDRGKFGGRILHYLASHGFPGRIVPINPRRATIAGLPCHPGIEAAGGPIDLAILAVPAGAILSSITACAAAGVGACVIVSTGFAEAGEEGARVQADLQAISRRTGMRIVGPNCMGLINTHHRLALSSSLVLDVPELPRGPIGLISQSGALMVAIFDRARDAGVGFSTCVSLGNQADVEICDILEYMIDDPATDAICMYIEGLRDGLRFQALARRARDRGKPVFAVKTGRTAAGVRAARSHTASLAGSYRAFAAVCREAGVVLMDDADAMVLAAAMRVRFGPARAGGIGVFSPSGGGAGIGVDRVTEAGLEVAVLGEATRARLRELLLPPQADNPIDLGGRLAPDVPGTAAAIMAVFAADPGVGTVFVPLTTTPRYEAASREIGEALLAAGKPFVIAVMPGGAADGVRAALRAIGCPFTDRIDDAIRILVHHAEQGRLAAPAAGAPRRPDGLPDPAALAPRLAAGALAEHEVKAILADYGIPVAREAFAADVEAAVAAARAIGFPVVLKAVARALVHKSDIGAVRLGLADEAAVRAAWAAIARALGQALPGARLEGCLVAEMVRAGDELILGLKRDDQFGPMILAGFGGTEVELDPDTALAPAPIGAEAALRLLRGLRRFPLLEGWRGRRPADLAAIVDAVVRLSWLGADAGGALAELDINPLILRAGDGRPVAVDARAATRGPGAAAAEPPPP